MDIIAVAVEDDDDLEKGHYGIDYHDVDNRIEDGKTFCNTFKHAFKRALSYFSKYWAGYCCTILAVFPAIICSFGFYYLLNSVLGPVLVCLVCIFAVATYWYYLRQAQRYH